MFTTATKERSKSVIAPILDVNPPFTNNNTISFNHVYNLFQGIMNDSGSLYFGVGTPQPPSTGTGNKMLNNKVHDVSDASALDADGYGGDGLYFDDFTGLSDAENNLVYRVSGNAISFSGPRAGPNQGSTVKNFRTHSTQFVGRRPALEPAFDCLLQLRDDGSCVAAGATMPNSSRR